MASILTPLTKLLNIDVPIISAPMAFASTGLLASAVSSAGAFGFMGAGFFSSKELQDEFVLVRRKLDIAPDQPVPIGVGFIGWILDMTESSPDPRLEAILEEKPVALWLAFGVDLGKYVAQIRAHDAVEDALRAANEWKVDIIVAQGIEAAAMEPLEVSTGKQIAALLTLGAAGVVLGTRFLFTDECIYSSAQKEVIVKSELNSTTRTLAFDEVGKTNYWPPKHNGRAIANDIIQDLNEGLDLEQRLQRFSESASKGESSRLVIWAGVGVGLTDKITSAQAVICSLRDETVESLKSGSKLLGL